MRDFMQPRHFSPSYLRILFVAMFVAAGLITPIRLSAQSSSAQPVAATSDTAKPEAAKPEAAKPEADPNDVYLHAPMVKMLADKLHLDVKTTAHISLGINFVVVVLVLIFLSYRLGPDYWLPSVLRNRTEKVRAGIESARKETENAYSRLSAIEAKLAGLDGEIAQIRAQVEVESREDEARIKSTIKEESARIVAAAAQEMDSAAAMARRSLRHFAADLAIEQAVQQLAITPETDRALIAEFLGDAAVSAPNKGGQK